MTIYRVQPFTEITPTERDEDGIPLFGLNETVIPNIPVMLVTVSNNKSVERDIDEILLFLD